MNAPATILPAPNNPRLLAFDPNHLEIAVHASLVGIIEAAPIDRKLGVFRVMASVAADEAAAREQQAISDLLWVAEQCSLVERLGAAPVKDAIADAFGRGPEPHATNYVRDEYESLSDTFASACRNADQQYKQEQSRRTADNPANGRVPKSTADAIDFLLKQDDPARLRKFLEGRPRDELEKIKRYIARKSQNEQSFN